MQVVRTLQKVTGPQVTIDLPESFYAKEVEIIVIPYQKHTFSEEGEDGWEQDFLSISQWDITEEDVKIKSLEGFSKELKISDPAGLYRRQALS